MMNYWKSLENIRKKKLIITSGVQQHRAPS